MIVLAFDTATPSTVVAVGFGGGRLVAARHDPAPEARPEHAARLLPFVRQAMEEAEVGWSDLDRVVVGAGPGSFTGLRLGVATARALAQGTGLPVATVGTLDVLAANEEGALPVIDARRREVFTVLERPVAIAPADLAPQAAGRTAIGDGAVRYRDLLEAAGAQVPPDDDPRHLLSPGALCRLGALATAVEREAILPHYIRDPDAVPRKP